MLVFLPPTIQNGSRKGEIIVIFKNQRQVVDFYLSTRRPKIDTQSIRISAIVFHQLLQRLECCSSSDKEATFIKLPDAIVLDSIAISH